MLWCLSEQVSLLPRVSGIKNRPFFETFDFQYELFYRMAQFEALDEALTVSDGTECGEIQMYSNGTM